MIPVSRNVIRYMYTVGVMVTGVFVAESTGGFESPSFWVALFLVGLGWVVYYDYVLLPRFEYLAERGS